MEAAWKKFQGSISNTFNNLIYKFDCLQVTGTKYPVHFKSSFNSSIVILIKASNAHHVKELGNKDRITYIKMKEKNMAGLFEAFNFPEEYASRKTCLTSSRYRTAHRDRGAVPCSRS